MKFKDLKKHKFIAYFSDVYFKDGCWYDSIGESYVINDETGLHAYYYWEDDREYCMDSGYDKEPYTWKDLKFTIQHQDYDKKYNYIHIITDRCPVCGCLLTPENYEYKIDFYEISILGLTIDYCNECKRQANINFEKAMLGDNYDYVMEELQCSS